MLSSKSVEMKEESSKTIRIMKIRRGIILTATLLCLILLRIGAELKEQNEREIKDNELLNFYLTIQDDALFNENTGIFTNYEQRGGESERPVHVVVKDKDGKELLTQEAGVRVVGQTSRSYPIKSLRLVARNDYEEDKGKFAYPFWGRMTTISGKPQLLDKYNSIVLRSVCYGHDTTGSLTIAAYDLARQAGLKDTSVTRPVNVYINGEYYGLHILTLPENEASLAEMYEVEDKSSICVTQKGSNQRLESENYPQEVEEYYEFTTQIKSSETIGREELALINKNIDIEQFMTYVAVETLLGNVDWPHNNFRMWKCAEEGNVYGDDRWRYLFYDPDHTGADEEYLQPVLENVFCGDSSSHVMPDLMKNEQTRNEMAEIYRRLMRTVFSDSNIRETFEQAEDEIEDQMEAYQNSELREDYLIQDVNLIESWDEDSREEFLNRKIENICNNKKLIAEFFAAHYGIVLRSE